MDEKQSIDRCYDDETLEGCFKSDNLNVEQLSLLYPIVFSKVKEGDDISHTIFVNCLLLRLSAYGADVVCSDWNGTSFCEPANFWLKLFSEPALDSLKELKKNFLQNLAVILQIQRKGDHNATTGEIFSRSQSSGATLTSSSQPDGTVHGSPAENLPKDNCSAQDTVEEQFSSTSLNPPKIECNIDVDHSNLIKVKGEVVDSAYDKATAPHSINESRTGATERSPLQPGYNSLMPTAPHTYSTKESFVSVKHEPVSPDSTDAPVDCEVDPFLTYDQRERVDPISHQSKGGTGQEGSDSSDPEFYCSCCEMFHSTSNFNHFVCVAGISPCTYNYNSCTKRSLLHHQLHNHTGVYCTYMLNGQQVNTAEEQQVNTAEEQHSNRLPSPVAPSANKPSGQQERSDTTSPKYFTINFFTESDLSPADVTRPDISPVVTGQTLNSAASQRDELKGSSSSAGLQVFLPPESQLLQGQTNKQMLICPFCQQLVSGDKAADLAPHLAFHGSTCLLCSKGLEGAHRYGYAYNKPKDLSYIICSHAINYTYEVKKLSFGDSAASGPHQRMGADALTSTAHLTNNTNLYSAIYSSKVVSEPSDSSSDAEDDTAKTLTKQFFQKCISDGSYHCYFCSYTCLLSEDFDSHIEHSHIDIQSYGCRLCTAFKASRRAPWTHHMISAHCICTHKLEQSKPFGTTHFCQADLLRYLANDCENIVCEQCICSSRVENHQRRKRKGVGKSKNAKKSKSDQESRVSVNEQKRSKESEGHINDGNWSIEGDESNPLYETSSDYSMAEESEDEYSLSSESDDVKDEDYTPSVLKSKSLSKTTKQSIRHTFPDNKMPETIPTLYAFPKLVCSSASSLEFIQQPTIAGSVADASKLYTTSTELVQHPNIPLIIPDASKLSDSPIEFVKQSTVPLSVSNASKLSNTPVKRFPTILARSSNASKLSNTTIKLVQQPTISVNFSDTSQLSNDQVKLLRQPFIPRDVSDASKLPNTDSNLKKALIIYPTSQGSISSPFITQSINSQGASPSVFIPPMVQTNLNIFGNAEHTVQSDSSKKSDGTSAGKTIIYKGDILRTLSQSSISTPADHSYAVNTSQISNLFLPQSTASPQNMDKSCASVDSKAILNVPIIYSNQMFFSNVLTHTTTSSQAKPITIVTSHSASHLPTASGGSMNQPLVLSTLPHGPTSLWTTGNVPSVPVVTSSGHTSTILPAGVSAVPYIANNSFAVAPVQAPAPTPPKVITVLAPPGKPWSVTSKSNRSKFPLEGLNPPASLPNTETPSQKLIAPKLTVQPTISVEAPMPLIAFSTDILKGVTPGTLTKSHVASGFSGTGRLMSSTRSWTKREYSVVCKKCKEVHVGNNVRAMMLSHKKNCRAGKGSSIVDKECKKDSTDSANIQTH